VKKIKVLMITGLVVVVFAITGCGQQTPQVAPKQEVKQEVKKAPSAEEVMNAMMAVGYSTEMMAENGQVNVTIRGDFHDLTPELKAVVIEAIIKNTVKDGSHNYAEKEFAVTVWQGSKEVIKTTTVNV
jgi:predicted small lipoprotein YifL